jgi:hypothetical protein
MKFRFWVIITGASLAFLFIIYTLFVLQIRKGEVYTERVQAQQVLTGLLAAERGSILFTDKSGASIPAATGLPGHLCRAC